MALINVLDQYVYIMVYKDIPHPDECLERWRDVMWYVRVNGLMNVSGWME